MVRPGTGTFDPAGFFALGEAFSIAFLVTLVKRLPARETTIGMMFWFGAFALTAAAKPGENTLEVDLVNTWNNRLVGDAALPAGQRHTSITAPTVTKDSPLLPAGLMGPVTLWNLNNTEQ
mgnify:CR=1 FL=1